MRMTQEKPEQCSAESAAGSDEMYRRDFTVVDAIVDDDFIASCRFRPV